VNQENLKSLIKVLAEHDPVARMRNGGLLQNDVTVPQDDAYDAKGSEDSSSLAMMTRVMPYATIKEACGNFSDAHVLGSGQFGKVYRCDLIISQRKRSYAVKKMDKHSQQGHSEFLKEVEVLTCCRHPNLVPLVAVSMHPEEPCLIYPRMGGGNLRTRISQKDKPLSWQKRFTIGIEVLRAIVYLHQREPAILHRDIKPDNVLLDLDDHARLSDVGLARFMEGPTEVFSALPQTSRLVGTFGYICPTFSSEGKYYPGSDGYGIGVLLLQLLTSKSAVDPTARPSDLASKMRRAGVEATALAADPSAGLWSPAVARKMASIALSLVQHDEEDRMDCAEALKEMESSMPDWDTEHIPEPRECLICMTENRDVRFLPCGHMLVCSNCIPWDYQSMDRFCYCCKMKIDDVVQDFPQTTTFVNLPQGGGHVLGGRWGHVLGRSRSPSPLGRSRSLSFSISPSRG
jgi:serine/threonine protein kinase